MDQDAVALRLGRLVLACALLELEVGLLAMQGDRKARKTKQGDQFQIIRRWSTGREDADAIRDWTFEANDVLNQRGLLVHGSFMGVWEGDGERDGFIAHKSLREVPVDLERLDALIGRAVEATDFAKRTNGHVFEGFIYEQGWADEKGSLIWAPPSCPNDLAPMELVGVGPASRWTCSECGFARED